jgi:hypothetical protein
VAVERIVFVDVSRVVTEDVWNSVIVEGARVELIVSVKVDTLALHKCKNSSNHGKEIYVLTTE